MPANKGTSPRGPRVLLILTLLTLFSAGILHSARSVRYKLDGKPVTEYTITDLSLTDQVHRNPNGTLTNPYADAQAPAKTPAAAGLCPGQQPVRMAFATPGAALTEMATKKPAPKKPVAKKPAPKKPTPKKPAKKKPKACPT